MIESVTAIERVEAVSTAAAFGVAARNDRQWRARRLTWLKALREAMGDDSALTAANERLLAPRARISEAQERLRLLRAASDDRTVAPPNLADVLRQIEDGGPRSIVVQARLGPESVKKLVSVNAVNEA